VRDQRCAAQPQQALVGGGALSRVWPRIIADVLDAPIVVPADPVTATSRGAFRVALAALGLPAAAGRGSTEVAPRPERRSRSEERAGRFARATEFLRSFK